MNYLILLLILIGFSGTAFAMHDPNDPNPHPAMPEKEIVWTPFDISLSQKDFDMQGPNHQILIINKNESRSIPILVTNNDSIKHEISFGIPYPQNISNLIEEYSFEPNTIQVLPNSQTQVMLNLTIKNNTDTHWSTFQFFAIEKDFGIVGKYFYIVIGDKENTTEIDPFIDHSMRENLQGPAFPQITNAFPKDTVLENLDKMMPNGFVAPRYLPNGYSFQGTYLSSPFVGLIYAPIKITNDTESTEFWRSGGMLIYSEKNSSNFNLTRWMPAYLSENEGQEIMINGIRGVATEQQERIAAYDEIKYKFPAEIIIFDKDTQVEIRGNLPLDELIKITKSMLSTNELKAKLEPPLKQFKSGIPNYKIQCKEGLKLVLKNSNGHPVCIRGSSVKTLTLRNYIPEYTGALGGEIPSGSLNSTIIEIPNNSGILLEGLKITYKIDEPIKFTLVLKAGQKCSTTEISIINAHTSEIVSGVLIDPLCNSKYYPQDSKIDIPAGYQNAPITINQPGAYKIRVNIDGMFVFENGFLVRSVIPG